MAGVGLPIKKFKDEAAKAEIVAAFKMLFSGNVDESGNPKYTDEEWAAHHIHNFIREQVRQYRLLTLKSARASQDEQAKDVSTLFAGPDPVVK